MRVGKYILLGLALFVVTVTCAQPRTGNRVTINMKAWRAFPVYVGDSTYIAMVGNVLCYHNGAVITCDSAVQFNDSKAAFFGDVLINKDNTFVYGDRATYDGNTSIARIYSPLIKMRDGDALMYTYNFMFDTRSNVGRFWGGAMIVQKQTQLEADRGYYYSKTKDFICAGSAELRDTTYQIRSDSIGYNTDRELATFYARTFIWNNDGDILSALRGTYHSPSERYTFAGNAYIWSKERELWADDIDYRAQEESAVLKGNIQILDHEQKVIGYGDAGRYWGKERNVMLTENPSVVSFDPEQGDSTFMRADTMWLYTLDSLSRYHSSVRNREVNAAKAAAAAEEEEIEGPTDGASGSMVNDEEALNESGGVAEYVPGNERNSGVEVPPVAAEHPVDTVPGEDEVETMESGGDRIDVLDSGGVVSARSDSSMDGSAVESEPERVVLGYRNVKIFRADFQAVCDSLISFSVDSTIHLYIKPIIWNDNNQITCDVADIYTKNQKVDHAIFTGGKPLMAAEIDTAHYNQVSGKVIEALFREGEMYRANVSGNGRTYYYIQDDKTGEFQGFLTVECADISFVIDNRTVEQIIYRQNPVYAIYPMDKIPAGNTERLEGFVWCLDERPASREEICDRAERPSQRAEYSELPKPTFPIMARIGEFKERLLRTTRWRDRRDVLTAGDREYIRLIISGEDLK